METTIWYNIHNCGDGAASLKMFESEELAEWDEQAEIDADYGWGDSCVGRIVVKHNGEIFVEEINTIDDVMKEIEEEMGYSYNKSRLKEYQTKLNALEEMRKQK